MQWIDSDGCEDVQRVGGHLQHYVMSYVHVVCCVGRCTRRADKYELEATAEQVGTEIVALK